MITKLVAKTQLINEYNVRNAWKQSSEVYNWRERERELHASVFSAEKLNRSSGTRRSEMRSRVIIGSDNLTRPPRAVSPANPYNGSNAAIHDPISVKLFFNPILWFFFSSCSLGLGRWTVNLVGGYICLLPYKNNVVMHTFYLFKLIF